MARQDDWRSVPFEAEGVTFYFPPELEHIEVRNLEKPPDPWPDPKDSTFKPEGFVIHFIFETRDPSKNDYPDQPFEMEVKYKTSNLEMAGHSCLQLGVNKQDDQGWRNLTPRVPEEDKETESYEEWEGAWTVRIEDWPSDPVVAWGS